jgi:hypothetical protein
MQFFQISPILDKSIFYLAIKNPSRDLLLPFLNQRIQTCR